MPVFQFDGRTASGDAIRGRIESGTTSGVAAELATRGIVPLRIEPAEERAVDLLVRLRAWNDRRRISLTDVIMLCRQLTTLVRAGVPITRGLRGLSETMRNPELGRVLAEVADQLEKGHELAGILQRHPDIFSNLFVAIVHIGESSGRLEESFQQLHDYLTQEEDTRRRVKSALRYPTLVLVSIVIAIGVINLFVVPAFAQLFASFGAELPWATRLLISSSAFATAWWPAVLAVGVLVAWGARRWLRTPEGRLAWHRLQLGLPQVGDILERALLARFCRTLAITLGAGLPVTQCLSIASRAVDNDWVGRRVLEMRSEIEAGDTLTAAAHSSRLFTPLVLQMLAVGEETGAVEETLAEVASYYEREVDYDLKRLGDSIEPVMIVLVGAMVLLLALGVYLPMWEMASAAKG
ncbi:MAG TPA: type II secretion system F family protein [Myxococcota bacterium]|nr:type II secretion system F family protein [Myxococcota bacterium]